jgi:hypothetical protein
MSDIDPGPMDDRSSDIQKQLAGEHCNNTCRNENP